MMKFVEKTQQDFENIGKYCFLLLYNKKTIMFN